MRHVATAGLLLGSKPPPIDSYEWQTSACRPHGLREPEMRDVRPLPQSLDVQGYQEKSETAAAGFQQVVPLRRPNPGRPY